eukprot:1220190-Rhodomonas_salina.1
MVLPGQNVRERSFEQQPGSSIPYVSIDSLVAAYPLTGHRVGIGLSSCLAAYPLSVPDTAHRISYVSTAHYIAEAV